MGMSVRRGVKLVATEEIGKKRIYQCHTIVDLEKQSEGRRNDVLELVGALKTSATLYTGVVDSVDRSQSLLLTTRRTKHRQMGGGWKTFQSCFK